MNWKNEEVVQEIINIVNFWINKEIKGFRFDVLNLISKPDVFEDDFECDGRRFYTDGNNVHDFVKKLANEIFAKYEDIVTVGR